MAFKAATPERPTNGGQWKCFYLVGAVKGLLRAWRWTALNQTPMADQVVPWPRLPGHPQKAISRVNVVPKDAV